MLSRLAIALIRIYQKFISPFIGAHCRFYPTCSNYAVSVYRDFGFIRGTWLTFKRIIKCGAWHPGGIDLPPKKFIRGDL